MKTTMGIKLKLLITTIIFTIISILSLTIAYADSYQLYCLADGEVFDAPGMCNPDMKQMTGPLNFCVHIYNATTICPVILNECNARGLSCSSSQNTSVDTQPPTFTVRSPVNGGIYNTKSLLFNLTANENNVKIYYFDHNSGRSIWSTVCTGCNGYGRNIYFKSGQNNLTIRVGDQSNNYAYFNLSFLVDDKAPKIISVAPASGFATETFDTIVEEDYLTSLTLNYGNGIMGYKSTSVNIPSCSKSGNRYSCSAQVSLSSYNGQTILYWFTATDIAGTSTSSTNKTLSVDTMSPVIDSFMYWKDAVNGKYVYFAMNITEPNLFKVEISDSGSNAVTLCSTLSNGVSCNKKVTFTDGDHDVYIKVTDKAGHLIGRSESFWTDSIIPKIKKTLPASRGFSSGLFTVEYTEANPTSLTLYYTNGLVATPRSKQVSLENNCTPATGKTVCSVYADLTEFNSQSILYWFTLTDIAGNSVSSRSTNITADTAKPIINLPISYSISGKSVTFNISITETYLSKVMYQEPSVSSKWNSMCTSLTNGVCSKSILFSTLGTHQLIFNVTDKAGNSAISPLTLNLG